MAGFSELPENLVKGSSLNQFVVELHSLRMDFSNGVSVMTQSTIEQTLSGGARFNYDVEDHSSELVLNNYLGVSVTEEVCLTEGELLIKFENGNELKLMLTLERTLDAVTVFEDGIFQYAIS